MGFYKIYFNIFLYCIFKKGALGLINVIFQLIYLK